MTIIEMSEMNISSYLLENVLILKSLSGPW